MRCALRKKTIELPRCQKINLLEKTKHFKAEANEQKICFRCQALADSEALGGKKFFTSASFREPRAAKTLYRNIPAIL